MKSFALGLLFVAALADAAVAADDPQSGARLAQAWCAGCHNVTGDGTTSDVAPAFAAIAATNRANPSWVRARRGAPHPPMQGINLSRNQIDDIVAYLGTIKPTHELAH